MKLKIKITQDDTDGNFTVGEVYTVSYVMGTVFYVFDNDDSIEAVYSYQCELVL